MDEVVDAVRRHGFAVVPGFLDRAEVEAGQANLRRYFPSAEEFVAAAPERYAWLRAGQFAGLVDFPWVGDALNGHATSPKMVALARRLLGADDVRMIQARAWAKYGGTVDFDQALHADYPNHTLVFPDDRHRVAEVIAFLYYTDVTADSGPTYTLSWQHTARLLESGATVLSREEHGGLYEHEEPATGPAGTLVVYTPATFHRGSAFRSPSACRWITGVAYRAAGADWIGHQAWPASGPKAEMAAFLTGATVEQRTVVGFPAPGDAYWTERTIAGVAARYPGLDLSPYRGRRASAATQPAKRCGGLPTTPGRQ